VIRRPPIAVICNLTISELVLDEGLRLRRPILDVLKTGVSEV